LTLQARIAGLQAQVAQLRAVETQPNASLIDQFRIPAASSASVKDQQTVFGDLSHYFQGGLRWMVEDGPQADMGLAEESSSPSTHDGEPMIAQFQLVRVDSNGKSEVISAPMIAILPGAEARFVLKANRGNTSVSLPYRCVLSKPDGGPATLSVSLDLNPPLESQSANLSGVAQLHPGSCQPVAYTRAGNVGYTLFVALASGRSGS
jgi:hypothetical protein